MDSMLISLNDSGTVFSTRSQGRAVFAEQVGDRRPQRIEVDFDGVTAVGYSFADEFIGELLGVRGAGDEPVRLQFLGARPQVERVIRGVLTRRGAEASADEMIVAASSSAL